MWSCSRFPTASPWVCGAVSAQCLLFNTLVHIPCRGIELTAHLLASQSSSQPSSQPHMCVLGLSVPHASLARELPS